MKEHISLIQVSRVLGSKRVSGMAQKVGLWPPHPTVSVRDLVSPKCLTQHYDNARTGWNPFEGTLTAANVSQLKQLFTKELDGTVYAQPLYVPHVLIPGKGLHNVVYVATENDTVYAFDADTNQPPLWQRSLIPPGEQIVVEADISDNTTHDSCNNIAPVIGITSTPVIDLTTHTMYVVAKTKKVSGSNTSFHYRIYALDITTGVDRVAPVEIAGSVPGTGDPNDGHGHVVFDPHWHLNRPGLLLSNGVLYVAFGSHCDKHLASYHGWVFGYDGSTLNQLGVFATTPDTPSGSTSAAGVWQGGMGLAADPQGFIYFTTGNGNFNANVSGKRDYGDTVIKLQNNFTVSDYFTPSDQPTLLAQDIDLGSGGVLIPPDPPHLPSVLVACGKDGNVLLVNRNNMGRFTPGGPDKLVQFPPVQLRPGAQITDLSGVWGGPAYYNNGQQQFVYYCGSGGQLKAYLFLGSALSLSKIGSNPNQSPDTFPGEGGTTPNVSSNLQMPATAVVWAIARQNPLRLQAFDATNLRVKLFDGNAGPWNSGGAFIEPTVVNGKVYVASSEQLRVFGL
jgi:hypothetical protein